MGAVGASLKRFLAASSLGASHITSFFARNQNLHTSRFARLHEHAPLLTQNPEAVKTGLLLGISHLMQTTSVRPTAKRRELGNMLVCAPPRMGKSLLAISQLLIWPHSVIVNDVKGELYAATAGYRNTFSDVFVIDFTGYGNAYDPLTLQRHLYAHVFKYKELGASKTPLALVTDDRKPAILHEQILTMHPSDVVGLSGKTTEDELLSLATHLLYQADAGEGKIFMQRAITMLMIIFLAAARQEIAAFPYLRFLIELGLADTAAHLYHLWKL